MDTLPQRDHSLEEETGTQWYGKGLHFKCTGCGKCCTGSPGYVFLGESDLHRLSSHLSLSLESFISRYVRRVDNRLSLIDRPGSDHCIFLKDKQCSVYEARPIQCRTFPWWVDQIRDEASWKAAGEHCEGINHPDAPLVNSLEIGKQCLTYLDNLLEQNFYES